MLNSVIEQTFENWECIIIDDGSTDDTENYIEGLIGNDSRFSFIERDSNYLKGPSGCRNYGIDICKGDYIIFFDSDDIVHPRLLETCVDLMKTKGIQFCNFEKKPFYADFVPQNSRISNEVNPTPIDINSIEEIVTQKLGFACCTILWDKNVLKGNHFNETLSYAEEWEFYIRLMSANIQGIHIDDVLYYHRKHRNSNTAEFWNSDPVRVASKVKAIKLVVNHLKKKKLLNDRLLKYFIRWGFQFKKPEIINYTLKQSDSGLFKFLKYKIGYLFYPLIKPVFNLKSKFSRT